MSKLSTLQIAIDAEFFARQIYEFSHLDQPLDPHLQAVLKAIRIAASKRVRRIQKTKRMAQPP
jgi:hypothetical protein